MTTPQRLKVEPILGVTFGAAITGIDLTDLSRALWADMEEAFNEYGLLVFPAQYLTAETQATFAKRFGPLQGADRPTAFLTGTKMVSCLLIRTQPGSH